MVNFGSLMKNALVVVVLVAVVESGAAEKLASCCKTVTNQEIKEPILGYLVQRPNPPCVRAVIFQTATGLFCSQVNAPWVRPKIIAFEKAKAKATTPSVISTSPVSLLSIITSTASPSSSSSTLSSSSSSSPSSSSSTLSSSSSSSPSSSPSTLSSSSSSSSLSSSFTLLSSSSSLPSSLTSKMPLDETLPEGSTEQPTIFPSYTPEADVN